MTTVMMMMTSAKSISPVDGARHGADDGRHDEHDDHRVRHLLEEADPQGRLCLLPELVGAVIGQTLGGDARGEAGLPVAALLAQDVGGTRQILSHVRFPSWI